MSRALGYVGSVTGSDAAADEAALWAAGASEVVSERRDSRLRGRSGLEDRLRELVAGDVLIVPSAAHIASSVVDFVSTSATLYERGIGLRSLAEPALSSGIAGAPDASATMTALRGLGRELRGARTRKGMASAASEGRRMGRPTVMTEERVEMAVELRRQKRSIAHIARVLGVSASAVQRALQQPPDKEVRNSKTP